jgi:arylsulfatase A
MKRTILATLCTLIATVPIPSMALSQGVPNIVIVLADDLGSGQLKRIGSPEIAEFAADSLRFRNAYAGSALCAPSRAALMTGQHTGHVAPRGNGRRLALNPDGVTIAEMLRDAGYATGLFGKWGFGRRDRPETWPEQHGWAEYLAYLSHTDAHDHTPDYLWQDGAPVDLSGEYAQDLFDDAAVAFVDRHADWPFLLYVSSALPHLPLEIPDQEIKEPSDVFAAMVRRFGKTVGRIRAALDAHDIATETLMIVTSDNGANLINPSAAWGSDLRGGKGSLYEGGIRVPLIARWPGQIAPGMTDRLVAAWDIYATAAELAGTHARSDGASILRDHPGRALYFEIHILTTAQAVRWERWKAIRPAPNEPLELYDLAADPREQNDLAEQRPDLVSAAVGMMEAEHVQDDAWPMLPRTLATDLLEAKRSLGRWMGDFWNSY